MKDILTKVLGACQVKVVLEGEKALECWVQRTWGRQAVYVWLSSVKSQLTTPNSLMGFVRFVT
jgi:hypothetical protein